MLRRLINRRTGERAGAEINEHAEHWRCIFADSAPARIRDATKQPLIAGSPRHLGNQVRSYHSSDEALRLTVLVSGRSVVSAFPQIVRGSDWPITISEVMPWSHGLEGYLRGTCMGAELCFFDTSFHANSRVYRVGETYTFSMGALAYSLAPAQELEAELEGGAKLSLKGAHAYMPAGFNRGAGSDDYWFHSPVEAPPYVVTFQHTRLRVYPVTLALPRDFPMSLTLYAAPHTEGPGSRDLAPGEDLQGYLWLQGHLAHSSHPDK